jgi:hypothetical protein
VLPTPTTNSYPAVFALVEKHVKPVRLKNARTARRERWWQHAERAPKLYGAIADLDRILVVARVSKTCLPVFTLSGQVMSEMTVVFPSDQNSMLALLNSGIHYAWAIARASSLKGDLRYTPSDVFETLPQPALDAPELARLGKLLDVTRARTMRERGLGLTKLYNAVRDAEVQQMRDLHEQIDHAVAAAYGWNDLDLTHGFHQTRQGPRHTLAPAAQMEVLDRLLELNHSRYGQETAVAVSNKSGPLGNLPPNEDTLF